MQQGLKTTLDLYPAKGFTINMAHFVKQVDEVHGRRHIVNNDAKLKIYIDSTYELGYIFGSFVSVGNSDIPNHYSYMGQVTFYTDGTVDLDKLISAFKNTFHVEPRLYDRPNGRKVVVVHSKPIARLLQEFGKKEQRHVPDKYLVSCEPYLKGLLDGITDFKGHLPDTRPVLNKRKYSLKVKALHEELTELLNND